MGLWTFIFNYMFCFLIRTDRLQDKKGSTIQKEYG